MIISRIIRVISIPTLRIFYTFVRGNVYVRFYNESSVKGILAYAFFRYSLQEYVPLHIRTIQFYVLFLKNNLSRTMKYVAKLTTA